MISLQDIQPVSATPDPVNDVDNEWDGTSYNKDSQEKQLNKDSTMDWAEHQGIVLAAGALLANFPEQAAKQDQAGASLGRLKKAYEGSKELLRVTKGIHQPNSDPHIQLSLWSTNGIDRIATYHLNVSPADTVLADDYFQWKPVQFVGYGDVPRGDGSKRLWPTAARHSTKRDTTRRYSISSPALAQRVAANDEFLAAKKAKAEEKIADDKAHPEKILQRKAQLMIPVLAVKGIVLPTFPKGMMMKFVQGEEMTVTYTARKGVAAVKITGRYDGTSKFTYDGAKTIGGLTPSK